MSDLPPPHNLPQYPPPPGAVNGKIKLKVPGRPTGPSATVTAPTQNAAPTLPSGAPVAGPSTSPPNKALPAKAPAAAASATPAVKAATPLPKMAQHTPKVATPTPKSANAHYPAALYNHGQAGGSAAARQQQRPQVTVPSATQTPAPTIPTATRTIVHSTSNSPAPQPSAHPLQNATLTISPSSRLLHLDVADGVRTWAVRLAPGERALRVGDVTYLDEGGEGGSESDDTAADSDVDMSDASPAPAPSRGRGRGQRASRLICIVSDGYMLQRHPV